MQPQDGNWADLVVQVVAWCIDLGVVGGMTGIEAFSGRFFPENLLYGPDLCGQVEMCIRDRLRASTCWNRSPSFRSGAITAAAFIDARLKVLLGAIATRHSGMTDAGGMWQLPGYTKSP